MSINNLAIVIPAYKKTFFKPALESIALQTDKRFNVYIGDDQSPEDLLAIIDQYKSRINIHYTRFSKNIGGCDLVGQWERCIDLVGDEEWIWLFSDDDKMDSNCVADFYYEMGLTKNGFDIFHFNVKVIDEEGNTVQELSKFPVKLASKDFFKLKSRGKIKSFVVEYIFRKEKFYSEGRFQKFDLAWFTDDATWIKLSGKKGIKSIMGSKISWRRSSYNISPNITEAIIERKLYSCIQYFDWLQIYNSTQKLGISTLSIWHGFRFLFRFPSQYVPIYKVFRLLKMQSNGLTLNFIYNVFYILIFRIYFRFKIIILKFK